LPCGKVERQRHHKTNTAYIVGCNFLLDFLDSYTKCDNYIKK